MEIVAVKRRSEVLSERGHRLANVSTPHPSAASMAAIALSLVACSDWKKFNDDARHICTKTIEDQSTGERLSPDELPTAEERNRLIKICSEGIVAAVEPCKGEYKYRTDSALQCIDRYGTHVLQEANSALIQLTVARQVPRIEATAALTKLWAGARAYYETDHLTPNRSVLPKSFPGGSGEMTRECCAPGATCPTAEEFRTKEPWASLFFAPQENKFLQYQFTSEGTGKHARYLAVVAINPQCSGRKRYFARRGEVAESGDVIQAGDIYESEQPPAPLAKARQR